MPRITQVTRAAVYILSLTAFLFCATALWSRSWMAVQLSYPKYISIWTDSSHDDLMTGRRPLTLTDEISSSESREFSRLLWNTMRYRPWFLPGGFLRPDHRSDVYHKISIWPDQDTDSDRIVNQLMYLPPGYNKSTIVRNKKIHLFDGRNGWNARDLPMGQVRFARDKCPVDTCEVSMDPKDMDDADLILFRDRFQWPSHDRPPHQIWLLFLLESPSHTQSFTKVNHVINWTASYRHDSDIVTPYEKFFPNLRHSSDISDVPDRSTTTDRFQPLTPTQQHEDDISRMMTMRKDNKVAWFVSNCGAKNQRLEYARELGRYIDVDIFGTCGSKRCPRSRNKQCFSLLNSTYKYYLAFENSNCRDYMTEKFFVNGLMNNILPIVMGAHPDDYKKLAPLNSYIHVDDFKSPKQLAHFLKNMDDETYNSYFKWKHEGEFINTYFWCRLCALLHSPRATHYSKSYPDLRSWWNSPPVTMDGNKDGNDKVCSNRGWRKGIPHTFEGDLLFDPNEPFAEFEAKVQMDEQQQPINTSKELLSSQEDEQDAV